jgi:hypothetical protein
LCLSWRLEDIDSHAGVTLPNTSQTPLGSGMGLVEEFAEPSDVEEPEADERQPLLPTPRQDLLHKRTPSLPLTSSPYRHRSQTLNNNESAQIWADLDDSENETASANRPPGFPYTRRRTMSLLSRGRGRRSDVSNAFLVHKNRDNAASSPQARRLQNQSNRRVSAPLFAGGAGWSKSPKRSLPTDSADVPGNSRNYGTLNTEQPSAWRKPLKMLQRWTSRSNHTNNEDPPV